MVTRVGNWAQLLAGSAIVVPTVALSSWEDLGAPVSASRADASWANKDGIYVAWEDNTQSIGLWKCIDASGDWQDLGLENCGPQALTGLGPHTLMAACAEDESAPRAYCSHDGGAHWVEAGHGVTETPVAVQLNESEYSFLLAGRGQEPLRIYRSDDMGISWTPCFEVPDPGGLAWRSIAIDPGDSRRAYALGVIYCGVPIFETTDGGDSWSQIVGPPSSGHELFSRLLTSPLRPGELFVLIENTIFERTGDDWRAIPLPWIQSWGLASLSQRESDVIYIGGLHPDPLGPVFMKSPDFGETWIDMSTGLPDDLTVHFGDADLYAVGDQALYLVHPDRYVGRWMEPSGIEVAEEIRLPIRVVPNPSRGTVEFVIPGSPSSNGIAGETLQVTDVQGRLVALVRPEASTEALTRYVWDGTDGRGRPVGSGVYFARPESQPGTGIRFVRSQ